jgi:hypothetical protein
VDIWWTYGGHSTNAEIYIKTNGQVAQSVEQRTENPRVGSSILPLATISISMIMDTTNDGKCDEAWQ